MSPRDVPPKGPQHSTYLEFLKAFGKQERPYSFSARDEYAFLWRQWQRDRVAERIDPKAWIDGPLSVPPARTTRPEPDLHEEAPELVVEPEPVEAPPAPEPEPEPGVPAPAKRKSRFQTLEL